MTRARTAWPPPAVEHRLAEGLLAGNPAAPAEVAAAYLAPLTAYLRTIRPGSDEDACAAAAESAVRGVCRRPTPYDPAGLPLGAFLRFVAGRGLPPEWDDAEEPRPVAAVAVPG